MKTDCFGYEDTCSSCRVLTANLCANNDKCPFYKTLGQLAEEKACAVRRLQFLNLYRPEPKKYR